MNGTAEATSTPDVNPTPTHREGAYLTPLSTLYAYSVNYTVSYTVNYSVRLYPCVSSYPLGYRWVMCKESGLGRSRIEAGNGPS